MKDSRGIVGRLPLISLLGANAIPLLGLLLVLVLLKTFVDVKLHFYEHRKKVTGKSD